jgi:outer membrane protein assembly factor BamB
MASIVAMKESKAEVVREYGPFPGEAGVGGVTHDGRQVWFANGKLNALDPLSGAVTQSIDVKAHAGTAFDGKHLFQASEGRILKIDPQTGRVVHTIPAPGGGGTDSGLAWAEGTLWVGQHRERKIHQIDPDTGALLRTIESKRFVTGVSWTDGELWHGTWEGDASDLRRVDPQTGELLETMELPPGVNVSGLEAGGDGLFYCGGGNNGKVRAVRRVKAETARLP